MIFAIVALGLLIIVHEAGHFFVARWTGMRVDRFSIGFGPTLATIKRGETEYQIGWILLGGFVQIAGMNPYEDDIEKDNPRSYSNRPLWARLATIFAGPGINYLFSVSILLGLFLGFGVPTAGKIPMVLDLIDGMPAQAAGIELSDEIISVDGKPVKESAEVAKVVQEGQGRPVTLHLKRGGEEKDIAIQPRKEGDNWRIGVHIGGREQYEPVPALEAIKGAFVYPYELSMANLKALGEMVTGKRKEGLSGPVGIVKHLKSQWARGWREGIFTVAGISALLGMFNLLPFPGLDGGRLVFLSYSLITRKTVPQRIEQAIHSVGILALFSFIIWVTITKDLKLLSFLSK